MCEEQKTFAEMLDMMRGRSEDGRMDAPLWRRYADMLEAAYKREMGDVLEMARNALDCLWKMSQLSSPVAKRVYKQLTDGLGELQSGGKTP